jgi:hypothetical protein
MTTNDQGKELADLRGRLAALEKQVATLQAGNLSHTTESRRADAKRAIEPQGVTITHLPDRNPSFVMPSDAEFRQLYGIVIARYPRLATRSQQAEETLDGFRRAFLRIAHLGRDKLNDKYTLMSWVDDARHWLNDQQYPSDVTGNDFVCAVIAHGDVDHVPLDRFPHDCSAFGLRRDGTGRKAADGWRTVLATGGLREPVPLPRPTVRRSPTQIAVGWGG